MPSSTVEITITNEIDTIMVKKISSMHCSCFTQGWEFETMLQTLITPGTIGWLHYTDDKPKTPNSFAITRMIAPEAEILTLGTIPDQQGQGKASQLLHDITHSMQHNYDIDSLYLDVDENNKSAIALYKSAQFAVCGKRKNYYTSKNGIQSDALLMTRKL